MKLSSHGLVQPSMHSKEHRAAGRHTLRAARSQHRQRLDSVPERHAGGHETVRPAGVGPCSNKKGLLEFLPCCKGKRTQTQRKNKMCTRTVIVLVIVNKKPILVLLFLFLFQNCLPLLDISRFVEVRFQSVSTLKHLPSYSFISKISGVR